MGTRKVQVRQASCPRLAKTLIGIFAPKGMEYELVETVETEYERWAIPKLGRYANLWMWSQVVKTVHVRLKPNVSLIYWILSMVMR
jgi:hypothetical protein